MEKTLVIDDKEILLKTHGAIPLLYKKQFGKDFFAEVMKLSPNGKNVDLSTIDTEIFYNLTWLFAKAANKDIPASPIEWLMSFDEFPISEVIPTISEMLSSLLQTKKK